MSTHVIPVKTYTGVFVALMVLLVATTALDFVQLGAFNTVIALSIAVVKMVLVVLWFMHVRFSSRVVWIMVGLGFYWLAILLLLTMSDFVSRSWPPFGGY